MRHVPDPPESYYHPFENPAGELDEDHEEVAVACDLRVLACLDADAINYFNWLAQHQLVERT